MDDEQDISETLGLHGVAVAMVEEDCSGDLLAIPLAVESPFMQKSFCRRRTTPFSGKVKYISKFVLKVEHDREIVCKVHGNFEAMRRNGDLRRKKKKVPRSKVLMRLVFCRKAESGRQGVASSNVTRASVTSSLKTSEVSSTTKSKEDDDAGGDDDDGDEGLGPEPAGLEEHSQ